ncbi:MAG: alpha/beta hydrolase family protein [Gammaproteobacteria bacterium]|nr:alpha/beta hydrolase family protein [Gammaproteobacteria bacterium]
MFRIACIFTLLTCISLPVVAADTHPYESPNIFGQAIWIGEGEERFPAIYAEAAVPEAKGIIIMLHAEGEHPQWPMVIQLLREQLTDHGWNTLALQLPTPIASDRTLDRKAYTEMVGKKIQMAVNHVMPKNPPVMVLLGHGLGANAVIKRATEHLDNNLMAVIGVSINADAHQTEALNTLSHISQLNLPILDVYAERDRLEVRQSTKQRKRAALKAGNKNYRQLKIPGAEHHFYNHTAMLGSRVKSWLDATYRKTVQDKGDKTEAFMKSNMETSIDKKRIKEAQMLPATDVPAVANTETSMPTENMLSEIPAADKIDPDPTTETKPVAPNPTGPEGLF